MYEKLKTARKIIAVVCIVIAVVLLILCESVDTSGNSAVALVGVILLAGILDGVLVARMNKLAREENDKKPVIAAAATVLKRRVWHNINQKGRTTRDVWYVTFDTVKHGTMELAVPYDVYLAAKEGTRGSLRYRGWEFISFRV